MKKKFSSAPAQFPIKNDVSFFSRKDNFNILQIHQYLVKKLLFKNFSLNYKKKSHRSLVVK